MKQLQSPKEPAPMPSDLSESPEAKQPIKIKIAPLEVKTSEMVIEEIALLGLVDPLPDVSKDEKTWSTLQNIFHPQPSKLEIDEDFLCPVTQSLIRDPVTTCDGQLYEREAIEQWFKKGNTTSPVTNKPLEDQKLTPNIFAKKQINALVDKNIELKDSEEWYLPQSWVAELKIACQSGDAKQIKELVGRDRRLLVHPFKEDSQGGQTALHFAAVGHPKALDVVIELLEKRQRGLALIGLLQADGAGRLPFHQAVLTKQDAQTLIKLMTRMGKQIAQIQPLPGGWPPDVDRRALNEALAWCIGQEDEDKVRCLLRLGADPHAKTAQGETGIYQAVTKGCVRSLKILLECKADPNLEDKRLDDSLLHAAVRRGDPGMVAALLKAKANPYRTLNDGRIPLHLAAERNDPEILAALAGEAKTLPADLREAVDTEGYTPLHRAVTAGSLSTVAWLLDHGARPAAVNTKGQTALHLAAGTNRVDLITLLLRRAASLSAVDHQGNTALHTAAEGGANQAVAALLKAGAV
ncbi:MAG: ankyrin repeat domain-containing protein, partial [Proteobacteria bacterium]|nr:ankyrin repeat domain-containing protein [Pseudomonadota bacterium]